MITIFSVPKPFTGPIAALQENAIASWTRISPRPEIILLGDEEGVGDAARRFGVRHHPHLARNEYGTPLIDHMFRTGEALAQCPVICYVNADIILFSDLMEALRAVRRHFPDGKLFAAGKRWNITLTGPLDMTDPSWEKDFRARLAREGKQDRFCTVDYFLFTKGVFDHIPPFALGRNLWDNWLLAYVRARRVPFVDVTDGVCAVHQNHDYSHARFDVEGGRGPEVLRNKELCRGDCRFGSLLDAGYVLTDGAVRPAPFGRAITRWRFVALSSLWSFVTDNQRVRAHPLVDRFVASLRRLIARRYA